MEDVVARETALLKAARLAEAGSLAPVKGEAARRLVAGFEALRMNAVGLARHAPDAVAALKAAQGRLDVALAHNIAVIATLRAVAEGIVRSLADEVAAPGRLAGYGPPGASPRAARAATPLLVARSL